MRDKAGIVIMDDNFLSVFNAARWGHNIFNNCKKFLQFQLTVTISCLACVILGAATVGYSPFRPMMLLWINFIMDIGAALALATEVPQINKLLPVEHHKGKFITPAMYRSIYFQALY